MKNLLKIFILICLLPSICFALPEGQEVVSGSAQFSQPDTNTLNITTSDKVIINYQGFGIAQPETVRFIQPSSSSAALNRVIGGNPSEILGSLLANGRIFLVNPNGIFFGPSSQIDTGSFLASTLNIKNDDFLNERFNFFLEPGTEGSSIINQGNINAASGGFVALLSPKLINEGVISASQGKIVLASAEKITLDFDGDGLINFAVEGEVAGGLIQNKGTISASGGEVLLAVNAAKDILANVINNEGIIEANSIVNKNGVIRLIANQRVNIAGKIEAEGGRVIVESQGADFSGTINCAKGTYNMNDGDTNINGGTYSGNQSWSDNDNITVIGDLTVNNGNLTLTADFDGDSSGDFTQNFVLIQTVNSGNIEISGVKVKLLGTVNSAGNLTITGIPINSSDINSIQTAIDAIGTVGGTSTINVAAGTYNEQVSIDKANLTLISNEFQTIGTTTKDTTLIDAGGGAGSKCVNITANSVTVQGFTIHNYEQGVYIENSNATIDNCIIYNTGITVANPPTGIKASLTQASNASVTITNNKIYDNVLGGSWTSSGGRGISISSDASGTACGVLIDNNEIYGNDQRGISLAYIGGTVSNNNIHNNGVRLMGRVFNTGILLAYTGSTVDVIGNTVAGTEIGSSMGAGVYIFTPADGGVINIDDNDILATSYGPGIEVNKHNPVGTINIINNRIEDGTSAHGAGIAIGNQGLSDTESRVEIIEGNVISSNEAGGICLWYGGVVGSIADNIISNNGLAEIPQADNNYGRDGIGTTIGGNKWPYEIEEIKDNTITGNFGCGVKLSEYDGQWEPVPLTNTIISGNTISGNGEDGIWCNSSTFNPTINWNNVYNNTGYGVNNLNPSETDVDATKNWWGQDTGPAAGQISDNVDTDLYLHQTWTGNMWVDGDYTVAPPPYDFNTLYYSSIQLAIDNAPYETTINVAAGTYDTTSGETFPITISKANLTIKSSDGAEATIIDCGGSDGIHVTYTADGTTIDGFTIQGTSDNWAGIGLYDKNEGGNWPNPPSDWIENCTLKNLIFKGSYHGIDLQGGRNNLLSNITLEEQGCYGIMLRQHADNNTIEHITGTNIGTETMGVCINLLQSCSGNTITDVTSDHCTGVDILLNHDCNHNTYTNMTLTGTTARDGIYLYYGSRGGCSYNTFTNVTIENHTRDGIILVKANDNIFNDIKISNGKCGSSGFYITGSMRNSIEGSEISNNTGCGVRFANNIHNISGTWVGASSDTEIHYSNIYNNSEYGICVVEGAVTEDVNATYNWWGNASGPEHSTNTGGSGNKVSDNVDYSPWLGQLKDASHPWTWHTNDNIQDAIDEASSGDIVKVLGESYIGPVDIDKDLSVQLLGNVTSTGNFTNSSGTLDVNGYTLTIDGNLYNYSSITLGAGSLLDIDGNLVLDKGGVALDAFSGTIDLEGDLALSEGTLTAPSGDFYIAGSFTRTGGNFMHSKGTVIFDSTATGKTITSGGSRFYNLTFNGDGGSWTVQDALDVKNDLTLIKGTVGGKVTFTAPTIDLDAETGIGETEPLELASTSISANTKKGKVNINNRNSSAVTVGSLTTGKGDIALDQAGGGALAVTKAKTHSGAVNIKATGADLTATDITAGGDDKDITLTTTTSGDILVGSLTATGDQVTLNSAGAIINNNPNINNIAGGNLIMAAASGIGSADRLETQVSNLQAKNTGSGNINISNTGDLNLKDSSAWGFSVRADSGNINISCASNMTIGDVVRASGSVKLKASTGSIFSGGGSATDIIAGSNSTLWAKGAIGKLGDALDVNITGGLSVYCDGSLNGLSVYIKGSVLDNVTLLNIPPGLALFNNKDLTGTTTSLYATSIPSALTVEPVLVVNRPLLTEKPLPFELKIGE